ncbi:MAG: alginate export family protein [Gammaproteobacteria bacterium]
MLTTFMLSAAMTSPVSAFSLEDIDRPIENALKLGENGEYGQIKFDLNYRYENANTEPSKSTPDTANASTFRLRLGYLTPDFYGLSLYTEYEGNQDFGANTYNSGRNGKTEYDIIADPQQHELNQFWLSYKGIPDTEFKVGRQRIKLDNDRFIGNVGWRQMEQTYDAAMITNRSLPNTTIQAGYMIRVQDIFSRENDIDGQFVNIGYDVQGFGKLVGYTYLLDFNEAHAPKNNQNLNSGQTYGARFDGGYPVNETFKLLYTAEYAYQEDYGNNPNKFELDYYNLIAGASAYGVTAKVGFEQLDGQSGQGFRTPLGTNHAFQGWADLFLTTPADGIRDIYGMLGANVFGVNVMGVYHDFDDDTGHINYGKEYDFLAVKKFGAHYTLLAKYAYYDADNFGTDTQKFWLQANISF